MERYPENTNISLDDFNACGWREALEEARREDYSSMWQQLSSRARKATEEGNLEAGKVLWLLADACSMSLKPNSLNEPFAPFMVMDGKRSALPEDFKNEDIEFFSQIIPFIDEPKLCARISDIAWLLLKPKNPQHALSAIDNYRSIEIGTESWIRDGRECWDRAIQLCLMLRAGAGERLKEIESKIVEALKESSPEDGYLANWLADLLSKHHLGVKDKKDIAEKLEALATYFEDSGDLHRARDYLDAASEWYKKSEDVPQSTVMIVKNAECWVKEAIARQASANPSNMVAASFYESAIHKYRTIPKALRDQHNVEERIVELRGLMNEAGENSLNEMGQITSGPIDISELIENSVKAVKGKELSEALLQFANVYRGARADKIRSFSEEMIRNHPLQSLFAATHMSSDGRVVAKKPAADLGGENQESVIWPEMVKHYAMELSLVVQGDIWPALEVIRQEHRLKEADFYSVVKRSPVVPPDRIRLMAKALFQGFDGDFISALHLLIPQIENLVRYHLKQHGEKTTNIDINGIENENGLSTLMDNPKVEDIFGKDLSFELKAIFCDPFGPNLRNELAHGLIGYEESQNIYSIYAWWLTFRLIFNTFWNANRANQQESEGRAEDNA
ncbi:DUF4209 domain-containing protein [Kangiella profundi]|uniref:DUF4209 domain-containing protein n=1 Tax=Kangiella profundi TaxID=1561924 RepID=A0A2K9AXN7_9GAMM|nr:DUF4209 domain-containing protein [Kangiella profundi]AUD78629.1 DUF4209 domain-containing protein [Kangiella profundi]GGF09574.1 DUF4209 domain-containing protein [Kangiella profundi]